MDNQTKEIIDQVVKIGTNYGIDVIGALVIVILGWMGPARYPEGAGQIE